MDLKEIAEDLGIGQYPAQMDAIYAKFSKTGADACDLTLIDRLQAEYDLFEEFYDLVKAAAVALNADPARSAWIKTATRYAMEVDTEQACTVPMPLSDGTVAGDFLPLFVLLPQIPASIDSYNSRGFSRQELDVLLTAYKGGIRIVESQTGRPGINQAYYDWLTIFAKAEIFYALGLQFQLYRLPEQALWLWNRQTKQLVPLMLMGKFHASGVQCVGSKGYEDEEGAFIPEFSEDEGNFYGHGVFDNVVSPKKQTFPKNIWECVGRPGEACLNIHVPRGSDISRETVLTACKAAMKRTAQQFPEAYATRLVLGISWLLNPTLRQIQGENAKTTQFMECFTKFPRKDPAGRSVFSFVFGKQYDNYEDLPEDTSLQRKLKKLYLDGSCLHSYTGAIYVEEEIL